jgi:hypothetical protein
MSKKANTNTTTTTTTTTTPAAAQKGQEKPTKGKHKYEINQKRIEQLKKAAESLKTAGRVVKKKKVVKKPKNQTDIKVQNLLKRFNLQALNDATSVLFFMQDQKVLQFNAPKVSAGTQSGVFVVTGEYQEKRADEILPQVFQNMDIQQIQQMLQQATAAQKNAATTASGTTTTTEKSEIPNVESFEQTA